MCKGKLLFSHVFEQLHSARWIQSPLTCLCSSGGCSGLPRTWWWGCQWEHPGHLLPAPSRCGPAQTASWTARGWKAQRREGSFLLRVPAELLPLLHCPHEVAQRYGLPSWVSPCDWPSLLLDYRLCTLCRHESFFKLIFFPPFNDLIYNGAGGERWEEEDCFLGSFPVSEVVASLFFKKQLALKTWS